MSFGMGINGFPRHQHDSACANKYAEWLSAKTGQFYRLPTEAEWEYACKAGGKSAGPLAEIAWYADNSTGKYQKVGTKKPNGWGLYRYAWQRLRVDPRSRGALLDGGASQSVGGSQNGISDRSAREAIGAILLTNLTCEARVGSDASWKQQDPQLPKSIWYETDAPWLGFRLVRPLKLPSAEEMYHYWNNGVEHDEQ